MLVVICVATVVALTVFTMYRLGEWRMAQRQIDDNIERVLDRQCKIETLHESQRAAMEGVTANLQQTERLFVAELSRVEGRYTEAAAGWHSRLEAFGADLWTRIDSRLYGLAAAQQQELAQIRALLPAGAPEYEDPMPNIEACSEAELLDAAQELAVLRPLVPYPNWAFDADWRNTEMTFRIRRSIWTYFNTRKIAAPLEVSWYYGQKLRLYLGNDLSKQLFVSGCIDPNEFVLLDRLLAPGMVFIDVGANEGVYAVFASARVGGTGAVWAVEPSRREMQRTGANLELNAIGNVRSFPVALADSDGEGRLLVAGYEHEGHNTLGAFIYDTVLLREEIVQLRRLDTLVAEFGLDRVDIMKLDVEGAELRALVGARECIRRFRPFVLFEANDRALRQQGTNRDEVIKFLVSQSYRLYLFDPRTGLPAPALEGRYGDNMLAVPAERQLPKQVFSPLRGGIGQK